MQRKLRLILLTAICLVIMYHALLHVIPKWSFISMFEESGKFGDYLTNIIQQHNSVGYLVKERNTAYLVNTQFCQIINWPIIDSDVRPLFTNRTNDRIECKTKQHNITIKRTNFNGITIENKLNKTVKCLAQSVRRNHMSDNGIHYTPESELNLNETNYFRHEIAVKVNCFIKEDEITIEKVVPLVPDMENKTDKLVDENIPNILILGIDSVSRLNFERHFPLTKKFITSHDFYTMYGYNKVGDNTFPNLTPFLTGYYVEDIWNNTVDEYFNYFPFIWNEYKKKGFATFYMEDAPNINTFNFRKKGFSDQPTDYYLRTFFNAMDSKRENYCYLDEPEIKIYYDYLIDFVKAMNGKNQKYFALHFMVRLTHDYFNDAGLMDPFVTNVLGKLFDDNLIEDTVVIFFSDHGIRYGDIRQTLSGRYEERLPFMHIHVPEKMRNFYIKNNQHRLTSPFDIHATLKHLIQGEPDIGLKYGKSLFLEIPVNRSCESIPISDHWCGCQTSTPIKNLTIVEPISEFIVEELNHLLANDFNKCVELSLGKTLSATEQHLSEKVLRFKGCTDISDLCFDAENVIFANKSMDYQTKHYMITIEVIPSKALFEATVNYKTISHEMFLIGDISRINLYGNQSHCISDAFLKKYCFCKNS